MNGKNQSEERIKNVILVALDGVRLDIMRSFPAFKKISESGMMFSNVITYAPHSIASFHAIFTGIYGCHNGVNSYFGTQDFKEEKCKTITQYMKENGFYCFGDSLNDLIVPKQGFDELKEQEAFKEFADNHLKIIEKIKEKNKQGEKCFVHLHCSYAHNDVVEQFIKKFKKNEDAFYENKKQNKEVYKSSLEKVDRYIEMITKIFEKEGLFNDSIFIFFSDHGTSIGEKRGERAYGTFCYDYGLKTFCVFIGKGIFPIMEVSNMVRSVDIIPTILDVLGIVQDKKLMKMDGKSLVAYKEKMREERVAFAETGGIEGPWPSPKEPNVHAIRTEEWKLIFNRTPGTFELYNIKDDPNEERNLVEEKKEKYTELRRILEKYISF